MTQQQLAIGVFDSGMGGLTVLRALRSRLPQESFIYLGDTARLPYGTKSLDTVAQYAKQMARVLVERHIKALVIACSTATTAALTQLQAMLPDMPVIGVLAPGASAAVRATLNQRIMVLATETTIATGAYHHLISSLLPKSTILSKACSVLVALAEEGMVDNAIAQSALLHYLSERVDEDTILLGCTHFPVFKPFLQTLLPKEVQVVDSADATALALEEILISAHLSKPKQSPPGNVHYLVTDSVHRFQKVGAIFLNEPLLMTDIELIDVRP